VAVEPALKGLMEDPIVTAAADLTARKLGATRDTAQAMSQENVEIVRRGYQAFAEGDMETVLRLLDPNITLQEREQTLDTPRVYHGHQGLLDMVAAVNEGLEDVSYTPERFVDVEDRVLVDVRRKGRGSLSGVPVERWQFHVWEIAKGRATAFRTYGDRQEALEAVGLRE